MRENPQSVNSTAIASTSDGVARPNGMTREEFIRRVLYSGEVTKLAQHMALVICILAEKGSVHASVRDLERITGWTRQAIRDHLGELDTFMKVTLGIGRAKTHFEIQGAIEDAFATAIVSGSMVKRVDAKVDAKLAAKEVDAIAAKEVDASVMANQLDAIVANQLDATKESFPPYPPSKKIKQTHIAGASASVPVCPAGPGFTKLGHGAWLNCEKIWHPHFTISVPAVQMQLALNVATQDLDCATICKSAALQWAAAIEGGQSPRDVIPQNIVGAIVGGARRGVYSGLEHKARIAATGGRKPFKPSRW